MKLYEIAEAYNSLENVETTDEIQMVLDNIADEFDKKVENIVYYIKDFESDAEALRTEEKRLAEKRRALDNKAKYLKEYIFNSMKVVGKDKVKAGTYDLRIQKNPKSVRILNESELLDEYFKYKKEIDKTKIKEAIEEGIEVAGAELVQGEGLRIKWEIIVC